MYGTILNKTRKSKGLTAQQVADYLNMGIRNYRKYESGHANPTLDTIVKIADLFDVSTDYLLGREARADE
jgi:transcriptional regulator with XRE-family HTH domain